MTMSNLRVRHCELCGNRGKILSTRERDGVIVRRLRCAKDHRWSTAELRPEKSTGGKRVLIGRVRALVAE